MAEFPQEVILQAVRECITWIPRGHVLVLRLAPGAEKAFYDTYAEHLAAACMDTGVKAMVVIADQLAVSASNEVLFQPDRCICGPDDTGEAPDCRTDCPVHGADAPIDPTTFTAEAPF